jgi:hypothetical protein
MQGWSTAAPLRKRAACPTPWWTWPSRRRRRTGSTSPAITRKCAAWRAPRDVALLTYGTIRVGADVDPVIERFYRGMLGKYWPAQRRYVDDGYRSLPFPFDEVPVPPLEMREQWALAAVFGYVDTWSATWALQRAEGRGPIEAFRRELASVWGPAGTVRSVHWDLTLRIGRL